MYLEPSIVCVTHREFDLIQAARVGCTKSACELERRKIRMIPAANDDCFVVFGVQESESGELHGNAMAEIEDLVTGPSHSAASVALRILREFGIQEQGFDEQPLDTVDSEEELGDPMADWPAELWGLLKMYAKGYEAALEGLQSLGAEVEPVHCSPPRRQQAFFVRYEGKAYLVEL